MEKALAGLHASYGSTIGTFGPLDNGNTSLIVFVFHMAAVII